MKPAKKTFKLFPNFIAEVKASNIITMDRLNEAFFAWCLALSHITTDSHLTFPIGDAGYSLIR